MNAILFCLLSHADEWRYGLGGEFNSDSHMVFDLGYKDDLLQIELRTDTLEFKRTLNSNLGKKWGLIRGEALIASLMPYPWMDGAPREELGSKASYGQAEFGSLRYFQWQTYAGGVIQFGQQWFDHSEQSLYSDDLSNRFVTSPQVILGRHNEALQAYSIFGTHLINANPQSTQGYVKAQLKWAPKKSIGPIINSYAGMGDELDAFHRFRLGGLNPYSIPMAGAGWGEWWVKKYAVAQFGMNFNFDVHSISYSVIPYGDLAIFDSQTTAGFGLDLSLKKGDWAGNIKWGAAPWIERQLDISRQSLWVYVGKSYSLNKKSQKMKIK